jgi:hypothetical protein
MNTVHGDRYILTKTQSLAMITAGSMSAFGKGMPTSSAGIVKAQWQTSENDDFLHAQDPPTLVAARFAAAPASVLAHCVISNCVRHQVEFEAGLLPSNWNGKVLALVNVGWGYVAKLPFQ